MPTESAAYRLIPHLRRAALARADDATDAQLFTAFVADRDEAAFAALVRRHGPTVLGVCRRVVGDAHLAEDAFQATFLVLARRAATVKPRELGAWLYGVAYRTALKARGAAARRRAREHQVEVMPHPTVSPTSPADTWADLQPVLDEELARLPDKYRGPVVLCDLGGRPQRAVARELDLPPATLANRLAAGRKLLAKRLTDRGVVLSGGAVAAALGWHAATQAVPPRLSAATVKLVCTSAAGAPAAGLPPQVVELSEGVMRMFLVSKLKAVAVGGLSVAVVLTGLGIVSQSDVRANPDDPPATKAAAKNPRPAPEPDDLTFLRRLSLDFRGTMPSAVEIHYFLADQEATKRGKLVEWMLPEHGQRPVNASCAACHSDQKIPVLGHGLNSDAGITGQVVLTERQYDTALRAHSQAADLERARAVLAAAAAEQKKAEEHAKTHPGDGPKADVERTRTRYLQAVQQYQKAAGTEPKVAEAISRYYQALGLPKTAEAAKEPKKREGPAAVQGRILKDLDDTIAEGAQLRLKIRIDGTDAEFLRRLSLDVRGVPPSKVEENYFLADTDPKKREKMVALLTRGAKPAKTGDKLVDEFLTAPDVAKQYAAWVRQKREAEAREQERLTLLAKQRTVLAVQATRTRKADSLGTLINDLQVGKRSDEQILDAVSLATLARFPTDAEKKLVLEVVRGQSDKRAAWEAVAQVLATTPEAKAHAEGLGRRAGVGK